jgi:hypothetical protein
MRYPKPSHRRRGLPPAQMRRSKAGVSVGRGGGNEVSLRVALPLTFQNRAPLGIRAMNRNNHLRDVETNRRFSPAYTRR